MATIREQTIGWLVEQGPGHYTVTRVADELGLTRRQTINALHGLAKTGLSDQLTRGVGGWLYDPPAVIYRQQTPEYKYDDGRKPTSFFPVGFEGGFKVIARLGNTYLTQGCIDGELVDMYGILELIDGPVEWLAEHDEKPGESG